MALGSRFTVGDLIMNVRSLGTDLPPTLPVPSIISTTAINVGGGSVPANTYFLVLTVTNLWGETLASAEQSVVVGGGNNAIQISWTLGISGFANLVGMNTRVYLGLTSGSENIYINVGGTPSTITISSLASGIQGSLPVISTAWLPDSNGSFVSAYTMFRWLNEALKAAARITGGIQDAVGVASVSGQRRYVTTLQGQWLRLDQCFYDGWELDLGNKAETFRNRNLTANIAISLMTDAQSDTTRLELYWTPSRTSGTATTTAPIAVGDVNIAITGVSGWLLADGYALISDGVNSEVVSYSAQTGTQLSNCIRGWAGTQPTSFATNATITELNIELNGYRMPYVYSVGQSSLSLSVPPGWEPFLKDYMLGTFRLAEQETQEGQGLQDKASKALEAWVKSNKPVAGPRQMRMYGDYGLRGTVPGGLTGPLIIP